MNQGNEEMRATYTDLYDRLDGLPPPVAPHAHYDDEENLKNIFCFLLVLVLLNTCNLQFPYILFNILIVHIKIHLCSYS